MHRPRGDSSVRFFSHFAINRLTLPLLLLLESVYFLVAFRVRTIYRSIDRVEVKNKREKIRFVRFLADKSWGIRVCYYVFLRGRQVERVDREKRGRVNYTARKSIWRGDGAIS